MLPGPTELALILVIILIVFGAGKLPEVMKSLGQGIRMFKTAQSEDEVEPVPPVPGRDVTPRKEIPGVAVDAQTVDERTKASSHG